MGAVSFPNVVSNSHSLTDDDDADSSFQWELAAAGGGESLPGVGLEIRML